MCATDFTHKTFLYQLSGYVTLLYLVSIYLRSSNGKYILMWKLCRTFNLLHVWKRIFDLISNNKCL